jgi:uncharacterized membrane protein YhiD involved in acid resistance
VGESAAIPPRRPDQGRRPRSPFGAIAVVLAVVLVVAAGSALGLWPASAPAGASAAGPASSSVEEFLRGAGAAAQVLPAPPTDIGVMAIRLLLAAVLGGAISFRGGRRRNEFQIVHTSMILAFTGAMLMIIVGSDLARAFGLVGASSIVRYRTPVSDPQALASLFVSMGAGVAVGVGLYELAIGATILVVAIDFLFERGSRWLSNGWYRAERAYEVSVETDTADETLQAVRQVFDAEHVSHVLIDYDRGKKGDNVKMGLQVGVPDGTDTEKLTLQILNAGARSVSWRLTKDS